MSNSAQAGIDIFISFQRPRR